MTTSIILLYKFVSDEYGTLYPYATTKNNEGTTTMFTKEQIEEMNVVTEIVSLYKK